MMDGFNISRQPDGGHDHESGCPRKAIKANQIPSMHQQHGRQPFMFHYRPFDDFRASFVPTFDPPKGLLRNKCGAARSFATNCRFRRNLGGLTRKKRNIREQLSESALGKPFP